jgi:hypothetical protein
MLEGGSFLWSAVRRGKNADEKGRQKDVIVYIKKHLKNFLFRVSFHFFEFIDSESSHSLKVTL